MIVKHTSGFGSEFLFYLSSEGNRSWVVRIDTDSMNNLFTQTRNSYGSCVETYTPILPLAFIEGF